MGSVNQYINAQNLFVHFNIEAIVYAKCFQLYLQNGKKYIKLQARINKCMLHLTYIPK